MEEIEMGKTLVTYFSATGTTAKAAEILSDAIGADLYEIRAKVPYTKADLNWMDKNSRSTIEMNDKSFRPKMEDSDANIAQYDTIFVGFPIWWYVAPTIINTFLESYDFSGKKIIIFATSGGSGFGNTLKELKVSVSETAEVIQGELMNGKQSFNKVNAWVKKLNL